MELLMVLEEDSVGERLKICGGWSGSDLTITLTGGTRPHIGAVAVAMPRPSLKGDGSRSATVSVLTLPAHRDDEVARWAARFLAIRCGGTVAVTAGIHIDEATPDQIRRLVADARALVAKWAERFIDNRGACH